MTKCDCCEAEEATQKVELCDACFNDRILAPIKKEEKKDEL